jgi:DNA-binding response OmpR family regulator
MGLELGADDYVVKPFAMREVAARIRAVLRRTNVSRSGAVGEESPLIAGNLTLDIRARTATVGGEGVELTAREFELLAFLMQHPRRAFRREELLENVWGFSFGATATVTVHIQRLREKVERDPANPRRIMTVWGVGYRFEPADEPAEVESGSGTQ